MRGRPRKPTALKVIAGTDRKNAATTNDREPESLLLTGDQLDPPAHLAERSKVVWNEVAPMLWRMRVLAEVDRLALEMLCDSVADYRYARLTRGDNFTAPTAKGGEMLSQWVVAMQMSAKSAQALMTRFGMDPAARSRLIVPDQGDLFDTPTDGPGRFFGAPKR